MSSLQRIEQFSTISARTSHTGLCSANTTNYVTPPTRTKFGERAFSYAGPAAWNSLPDELRAAPTFNIFKRRLNTRLFNVAFNR